MFKVSDAVKKETLYISVWVVVMSVLMNSVFLLMRQWDLTVLFGNILSAAASLLNFFLMGLTVQNAVSKDEKQARNLMKASQFWRSVMIFAAASVGVIAPWFNIWAVLLTLFFPRIAISFRMLFDNKTEKQKSGGAQNE